MKLRNYFGWRLREVLQVIAVFGILVFALICCLIWIATPSSGKVSTLAEMRKTYIRAGYGFAGLETNSVLKDVPFNGEIAWTLDTCRCRTVTLRGNLEKGLIPAFIARHQTNAFQFQDQFEDWLLKYACPAEVDNGNEFLIITDITINTNTGSCRIVSDHSERTSDFYRDVPIIR